MCRGCAAFRQFELGDGLSVAYVQFLYGLETRTVAQSIGLELLIDYRFFYLLATAFEQIRYLKDRMGLRGFHPVALPHHRTYGFPYPAVEPGIGQLLAYAKSQGMSNP